MCSYLPQILIRSKENNSTVALILTLQVYDKYKFRLANYHSPYPLDISGKNVGILPCIRSNIPTHQLNCGNLCKSIQVAPFEINLRKEKWFLIPFYRPPSQNCDFFLNSLTNIIDISRNFLTIT